MKRVLGILFAGLAATLAGCEDDPTRAEVLEHYATDVASVAYDDFAASSASLRAHVEDLCAGQRDVDAVLDALDTAREDWMRLQAMLTGPAMERRSPSRVDWPVKVADIEALVERSADGEITADVIGNNVGADTRGLTAIRLVLARDDVAALLDDQRWCDYVTSTADVVAEEAGLLSADWQESWDGGPAFSEAIGDDADVWLAMIVNDNIFLAHELTEEVVDEGDVAPLNPTGDRALQIAGVVAVIDALAPLLDEDLVDRLRTEIDAVREAYDAGDVDRGRERAADVEATLGTEVVAQLDISITFSDQDGDSAG